MRAMLHRKCVKESDASLIKSNARVNQLVDVEGVPMWAIVLMLMRTSQPVEGWNEALEAAKRMELTC